MIRTMGQPQDPAAPSLSVVMPCYNAATFIGAALRSVIDQGYPGPLEIIVVDDGSADRSVEIAAAFEQVLVLEQPNQGPAAARNRGIERARGELIAFLDADDEWLPGSLAPRIACLVADPGLSIAFGDLNLWYPADASQPADTEEFLALPASVDAAVASGWLYPHILLDTILSIITAVVRRRVFDAVGGFDERLRMGEDYEFWIRAAQAHRFHKVDQVVARYRRHPGGTTRIPRPEISEYRVVTDAIARFGLAGKGPTALPRGALDQRLYRLCFDHGYSHFWHGDARIAARSFRRALAHDAWRPKALGYYVASLARALAARDDRPNH